MISLFLLLPKVMLFAVDFTFHGFVAYLTHEITHTLPHIHKPKGEATEWFDGIEHQNRDREHTHNTHTHNTHTHTHTHEHTRTHTQKQMLTAS